MYSSYRLPLGRQRAVGVGTWGRHDGRAAHAAGGQAA